MGNSYVITEGDKQYKITPPDNMDADQLTKLVNSVRARQNTQAIAGSEPRVTSPETKRLEEERTPQISAPHTPSLGQRIMLRSGYYKDPADQLWKVPSAQDNSPLEMGFAGLRAVGAPMSLPISTGAELVDMGLSKLGINPRPKIPLTTKSGMSVGDFAMLAGAGVGAKKGGEKILEKLGVMTPKTPPVWNIPKPRYRITPQGPVLIPPTPVLGKPAAMPPAHWNLWGKATEAIAERAPKDFQVWGRVPNTPVISITEGVMNDRIKFMHELMKKPAWHKLDDVADWIKWEKDAVDTLRLTGGDWAKAMAKLPPEAQELANLVRASWLEENKVWKAMGLKPPKADPFYIFPHVTRAEAKNLVRLERHFTGVADDFRTTLGTFGKPREYETMAKGIASKARYVDPRTAIALRLWAGQKVIMTGRFVGQLLENKVLFKELADARTVATSLGGKPTKVLGLPGGGTYWARTAEEAKFIHDQLKDPNRLGGLAKFVHLGNTLMRRVNLWNPLPHFSKNMLYKYGLNRGSLSKVAPDMAEYWLVGNPTMLAKAPKAVQTSIAKNKPIIDAFQHLMPFDPRGKMGSEILYDILRKVEYSEHSLPRKAFDWARRAATTPSDLSSRAIFGYLDPALKYARFKQYVKAGVEAQDAVNRVHLDLIRYGMRSDLIDIWKSIPLNYFVPWRVGTVVSLFKSIRKTPLHAAMWIGGIDLLREMNYRANGWWLHLPIDYVEAPIMRLFEDRESIQAMVLSNTAFGPGGDSGGGRMISDVLRAVTEGKLEGKTVARALWGLAMFWDPHGAAHEADMYFKTGDEKYLAHLGQMVILGAHDATNYAPRRPMSLIPESILPKSDRVKSAEGIQQAYKMKREHREMRRQMAPRPSIKERVGD